MLILFGDGGRRSNGNLSIVPPASWETAVVGVHHDGMMGDYIGWVYWESSNLDFENENDSS